MRDRRGKEARGGGEEQSATWLAGY